MAIVVQTKKRRPIKYGNKKVVDDGVIFDSRREWRRYITLKALLKNGLIEGLEVHPKFSINVNGMNICSYFADFTYLVRAPSGVNPLDPQAVTCGNRLMMKVVEDVKGVRTRDYIIKKRLMKAVLGIEIQEI